MAVPQLALDAPSLQKVISATADAESQLNSINLQVQTSGESTAQFMVSDAGGKLSNRTFNWNQDFQQIITALQSLNEQATGMLQALVAGNANAAGSAGA